MGDGTHIFLVKKGRRMIKKSTKENIEKQVISYWKKEDENPTLKELFYAWMKRKLEYNDFCQGTYDRYKKDFKRFFENESGFSERRIRNIESKEAIPFFKKGDC